MTRKSVNFLPTYYRTDKNLKFLSSTLDQLISPPQLERLNGYIGSKITPTYKTTDQYIAAPQPLREKYQLEPGLVVYNSDLSINRVYGYDDLINQLKFYSGNVDNLDKLFRPDYLSFDPRVNWDKLINYSKYYWLPTGPDSIKITGTQREVVSTFNITDDDTKTFFVFSPDGLSASPQITLYRGVTYIFNVNSEHNFYIKESPSFASSEIYNNGITNNGTNNGQIIFSIDIETPSVLYYSSDSDAIGGGQFVIKTIDENSKIDIEKEILGKQQFKSANGVEFINGIRVQFGGDVIPELYRNSSYIVEGVGDSIKLINWDLLETPESISEIYNANFDSENFDDFPFDNFKTIPITPSYITINKASKDLSPWTRYNRWFHEEVIASSYRARGELPVFPDSQKAQRPIIEFAPDLQLLNFGKRGVGVVDLIDNITVDVFSAIQSSPGYYIDGVLVEEGMRVVFNADTDPLVRGKVYDIEVIGTSTTITLKPVVDIGPEIGDTIIVTRGDNNGKKSWHFTLVNGIGQWVEGQSRTERNQAPIFDVFDGNGISYSTDENIVDFQGTKIFGYAIGNGANDSVLGFPLKYQNTTLESSFLFQNYFNTDYFTRTKPELTEKIEVSASFIKSNQDLENPKYLNIWTDAEPYLLPVLQFNVLVETVKNIEITVFDDPGYITDLDIVVFVNDIRVEDAEYFINTEAEHLYVNFLNELNINDRVLFKLYTSQSPNVTGTYETPINLTNNPFNEPVPYLSLGELYDHVNTMVDRNPNFKGIFPGTSNLGQLLDPAKYASRIILNQNPLALAQLFISDKKNNVIDAIRSAGEDYAQFKLNLIKISSELEPTGSPSELLDQAIFALNQNKNISFPYALSDMCPSSTNKKIRNYTVTDSRNIGYSITNIFDPTTPSNQAVIVYLNEKQLLLDKDYHFELYDSTVAIDTHLSPGDNIVIVEYRDTDGCYIPPTPTKLGLYPKFEPMKYLDSSFAGEPQYVIQGHDGSLTLAFNDYRDDVILEFENRVFNNLKVSYKQDLFDINSILPSVFRKELYSYDQTYASITKLFTRWASVYAVDYENNLSYDQYNHKTYNYSSAVDVLFGKKFPGSWRAIYKYYFDTDRPDTHPWEMLGFSIKPTWWDDYYGPYPYTSGNHVLWRDLENGYVAHGESKGYKLLYARPGLSDIIPVDENGKLIDLRNWAGIRFNDSLAGSDNPWKFGDIGPAENSWRRSSFWPFAVQIIMALSKPADYSAKCFDTSLIKKNLAGQYQLGGSVTLVGNIVVTGQVIGGQIYRGSGYSVYVVEAGKKRNSNYINELVTEISSCEMQLFAKMGGFVSKEKLNIVVDSIELASQNPSPYLPPENFQVHFNVGNPIKSVSISGIIVIKSTGKYVVRGYDKQNVNFKIFKPIHQKYDSVISVGSKSEDYVSWSTGQIYTSSQIVFYQGVYYRTITTHTALDDFNKNYFSALPGLPSIGGLSVTQATRYETTETEVPYGTGFETNQEVVDFILGYNQWLEFQGFEFNDYNADFQQTINWEFSAKEFLYWTTQNWAENSVITLSPFANQLKFQFQNGVVDNVLDSFYEYSLLRADGLPFPSSNFNFVRESNILTIGTKNTLEGIYFAKLNLIQKEHALVFDNKTIFNDVIYQKDTGYRQRRVKVEGFRTAEWQGDFFSPGFVYDNVRIDVWEPYVDYMPAEVVEHIGKYYSAIQKITGSQNFDATKWVLLDKKPEPELIANFEYKISQFEDFYSLDIDNFDLSQQRMAQHLTGYSPRSYLDNIFDNSISQYKFYQGFIKEKGTINALTKLEKASTANLQGKLELFEEWAFRVGSFGSYSSFDEIEIPLRERDFIENSQVIELVTTLPEEKNELISYITYDDVVIKPKNFVSEHTFKTLPANFKENLLVLPSAGYVRIDDVKRSLLRLSDISTSTVDYSFGDGGTTTASNVASYFDGDKIWVAFDNAKDWNVYRYTRQPRYVSTATLTDTGFLDFTTNNHHGLVKNDIVSIVGADSTIDGVYTVASIPSLFKFRVKSNLTSIPLSINKGKLFKFTSSRASNIDDLSSLPFLADTGPDELFWVDDIGNGKWGVMKKSDTYTTSELFVTTYSTATIKSEFGSTIVKQHNSSTIIVSAPLTPVTSGYGEIHIYDVLGNSITEISSFTLNSFDNQYRPDTDKTPFGDALCYDSVDNLIFASASHASTNTVAVNQGLVKVSSFYRSNGNLEIPYAIIRSPIPQNSSTFGASLFVQSSSTLKTLLISAPGFSDPAYNKDTGAVFRFDIEIQNENTKTFTGLTATITTSTVYPVASGTNATFDIILENGEYTVTSVNTGSGYFANTVLTITGDRLGGINPTNDLKLIIENVNASGSIESIIPKYFEGARRSFLYSTSSQQMMLPLPGVFNFYDTTDTVSNEFGYKITGRLDGTVIAVSAPGWKTGIGSVHIYKLIAGNYQVIQSILPDNLEFNGRLTYGTRLGTEILMSDTGSYLFISSTNIDDGATNPGKVWVYEEVNGYYEFLQLLENPSTEPNLRFGCAISANSSATIITVTSQGTSFFQGTTFDSGYTTFDSNSCKFGSLVPESGTAYVYNRYNKKFLLGQELFDSTSIKEKSYYGISVHVDNDDVYIGSPGASSDTNDNGAIYRWRLSDLDIDSWSVFREQPDAVDVSTIRKACIIDSLKEQIVDYFDVIDPLKGSIPGLADQELRYKTPFDPAVYNVGTSQVVVDENSYWSSDHVGELWWDISSVKYVWYEQGEDSYRKATWGRLFPGVTIDIYEWVESTYSPSQWETLADTNEGLSQNISGQPKFNDDTIYTSRKVFNKNVGQFTTYYYFWVKNKAVLPNINDRKITASEVSKILTDPKSYGLQYISILSSNSIALTNFQNNLISDRVFLNIGFDRLNSNIKKHTEWALVQENNPVSQIPKVLEQKLFDSLLGKDTQGNAVPDIKLSDRLKHGVEIRPKQTMFVDRVKAAANLIEYTNDVLLKLRIRGFVDFDNLNSKEEIPNVLLGEYDQRVEDIAGRDIILTNEFVTAKLSCELTNGRISKVNILEPGNGYLNPPNVTILNASTPVEIKTFLNENGQVVDTQIVKSGFGFSSPPQLIVRGYTVIIEIDPEFNSKWSKYEWNGAKWIRIHTQQFNTTLYWNHADWADPTYNPLKLLTTSVDETYQLYRLLLTEGDYVRVNDPGDGKYIILRKTDGIIGTFDQNFDVVYVEDGTIQISNTIYDIDLANFGYDDQSTFDQTLFDQTPETEFKNILYAIKNDIFIGENKILWNKFFFLAVKYALTEQKFLDWAFKTAFINVRNIAGILDQRPTYRFQDPTWYEDYLKEIKPFHTKIRNYQTNYQVGSSKDTPWEPSQTYTTDFDLPPVYNPVDDLYGIVDQTNELINTYPYKAWNDNYKLSLHSIVLDNPGSGYRTVPEVMIIPAPGEIITSTATAQAFIGYGKIIQVVLTNEGEGYTKTPTALIVGGGDTSLTTATASVRLANTRVRSNKIKIKFDRISSQRDVPSKETQYTIECDGNTAEFNLPWYASLDRRTVEVFLDGIQILDSEYVISQYTKDFNGYTKKYSNLVFTNTVPVKKQILTVNFNKGIEIYSAADRILDYYNPQPGMPGRQLEQLMEGVAYPGTAIDSLPFKYSSGYDVLPYEESSYANDVNFYSMVTVSSTSSAGANSTVVSDITGLTTGMYANLVVNSTASVYTATLFSTSSVSITSINTATKQLTFNATFTDTILIGTSLELWSFNTNSNDLDSAISGGGWTTTTPWIGTATDVKGNIIPGHWSGRIDSATGLRPTDIIIDGDGFVTPFTSHAPEEVVPGQVQESLSISVFTRATEGSPLILNQSYYAESTTSNVVVELNSQIMSTSSVIVTFDRNYLTYGIDYELDVFDQTVTVYPRGVVGYGTITLVGVGGSKVLGTHSRTFTTTGTVYFNTQFKLASIGSIYVTANGETLQESTGTTLGYKLGQVSNNNVSARLTIYGLTAPETLIQVWYFESEYKGFSEIKEQIIEVSTTASIFDLIQPPGVIAPLHAQAIVELNGLRLNPPETTYYEVTNNQTVFEIRPNEVNPPGVFPLNQVEVYRNGVELVAGIDWNIDSVANTVLFNAGDLDNGDVLAISYTGSSIYEIIDDQIIFLEPLQPSDILKIITFTNHNGSQIRTEMFRLSAGSQYVMERPVLNNNYVWVSVSGKPLIPNFDYKILDDHTTIQISDAVNVAPETQYVVTTATYYTTATYTAFSATSITATDTWAGTASGYMQIVKVNLPSDFDTIVNTGADWKMNISSVIYDVTVVQTYSMDPTQWEIQFLQTFGGEIGTPTFYGNASYQLTVTTPFVDTQYVPISNRVVITSFSDITIDRSIGYRIFNDLSGRTHYKRFSDINTTELSQQLNIGDEFIFVKNGAILSQPSPSQNSPGAIFIAGERIEYFTKNGNTLGQLRRATLGTGARDYYLPGTTVIDQGKAQSMPFDSTLYVMSTVTTITTSSTSTYGLGSIVLNPDILAVNQVEVYYGGRLLNKSTSTYHDMNLGFDSGENDSDFIKNAEFTIDTGTNQLNLSIPVTSGTNLMVVQKKAVTWHSPNTSLLESTTPQAQFLLERQSGLPDKYQYGKQ